MPAPVCADELRRIYDAIMALGTGKAHTTISFGDRSVTYSQSQLRDLRDIYAAFWRQCGADSGLPDLTAAGAVTRGAPASYRFR